MVAVFAAVGGIGPNGTDVATKRMERTLPMTCRLDDQDYRTPFPLTARLNRLTIKVDRPPLSPEDVKKRQAPMREKAIGA